MPPNASQSAETTRSRGKGRPRTSETAAPSLVEILNLIRTERATTRQALERESELGRAVVADRLQLLSDLGLVDESELGLATGGRAPRLVRFSARRGLVLVATLDQTAIGVGVSDLSGNLLTEHHEAADLTAPASQLAGRLSALFNWCLERQTTPTPPWGISLSVPGTVPTEREGAYMTATPPVLSAGEEFPLVETLTRQFGVPVWIRSSVETMTMGELHAGAGQGLRSMLFIKVGRRIGAGIVCDGQLYRGAQGAAGLIGALPVTSDGVTGTLDMMAGSDMIQREGRAAADSGRSPVLADLLRRGGDVSPIEVSQAAQVGDPAAVAILSKSGHLIGQVVATLANALNPDLIVLSGTLVQTNDILLAGIREAVYGASHPLVTRDLRIIRSQMGSSAGLVGAARVASEAIFAPAFLKDWIIQGKPTLHPEFIAFRGRADKTEVPQPTAGPPIDASEAQTLTITGLGPHGERAAPPERVSLLPEDRAAAKAAVKRVAIVLHTLNGDWTKLQISGMLGSFGDCGVIVTEVVDCGFSADRQVAELDRLIAAKPDAIVALPVANDLVVAAFRRVSAAGIRLVLLENVPTGLLPGSHYTSLVSSDNFGLGRIAAAGLAPHLAQGATLGVLGFAADFFATNEREIAFTNWMQANRTDVRIHVLRFGTMEEAADLAERMIADHPEISGFFVVWDTPATTVMTRLQAVGRPIVMATVDLGEEVAIALAAGAPFVSVAAQQPFQQGVVAARTTVLALLGRPIPPWIALPGIPVTRDNVVDSFQIIWRKSAPRRVLRSLGLTP